VVARRFRDLQSRCRASLSSSTPRPSTAMRSGLLLHANRRWADRRGALLHTSIGARSSSSPSDLLRYRTGPHLVQIM
jgi:hypothetical protein